MFTKFCINDECFSVSIQNCGLIGQTYANCDENVFLKKIKILQNLNALLNAIQSQTSLNINLGKIFKKINIKKLKGFDFDQTQYQISQISQIFNFRNNSKDGRIEN